jgi:hypothetical protein
MNDRPPRAGGRQVGAIGQKVLSLAEARRAAKDSGQYVLWLNEKQARMFHEPGWIKREPARDGGVLFVHPQREIRAARQRGIL